MPPLPIEIQPPSPAWPAYYALISHQLSTYLLSASVPYTSITHIGSTSIPHLAAKPNIDIAILVPSLPAAIAAREALIWEPSDPKEHYRWIGDGGIRGRWSMKLVDWRRMPRRSVYIIREDDGEGMLGLRGYLDLKRVLKEDEGLREEYEAVKWAQVAMGQRDGVAYGRAKNGVVAKVLRRVGWTEEEIRAKEALDVREEGVDWDDEPFT
jgi:GrpB-like predicted nucleotidyltransferase (UPF0157 family)